MAANEDKTAVNGSNQKPQQETLLDDEFSLELQEASPEAVTPRKSSSRKPVPDHKKGKNQSSEVLSYRHDDKRTNNPHVGMVDTHSDGVEGKTAWQYDPHIDPALNFDSSRSTIETLIDDALASGDKDRMQAALEQLKRMQSPYLNWSGKAERTSFSVDTVSLHVHERIDPATILAAVQKKLKDGKGKSSAAIQPDLFHAPFENLPLREAIDFYKHDRDWANRLIAGDSLLVMNSLLQKEGMAGQVQMIYLDPPYGIKYGSNFQPFVNKRDVKDRSDEDLTQEPEMIKAFRDTWELGIHSYLTYLRDRLLLAKELLHESGSVFVQISDENLHHVRELMDEIFGQNNFVKILVIQKTGGLAQSLIPGTSDFIVWYARNISRVKYRQIYFDKVEGKESGYRFLDFHGNRRPMTSGERSGLVSIPHGGRVFQPTSLESANPRSTYSFLGTKYDMRWKTTNPVGLDRLKCAGRLQSTTNSLRYVRFLDDFPVIPITNVWTDTGSGSFLEPNIYVVQTTTKVTERCLLMTTDPGDLVLDPTCGSGTTAFVAEKWGRRWITTDTSRVAVTLAKQRLMTASYDYFELKYPHEGLRSGFIYKTVPHVTLKSIANNPEIDEIYARMHPGIENALAALNRSLSDSASFPRRRESSDATKTLDSRLRGNDDSVGQSRNDDGLKEWEVPFDFPVDWPEAAKKPFDAFHAARQAMQKQMDASIAAHAGQEILYDQPAVSKSKLRITGPFTVEAVPFATVLGLDEAEQPKEADIAVARSGATWRQSQWRDELLKAGIRGKGGQKIQLLDLVPLPGAKYIHAIGTVADTGDKVAVSFGPEHAALEQRQVEIAMREAGELFPLPKMLVFCAFTFDPEAAKDIDTIKGITALRVQMNTDLLTEDLKKGRASNESFWLMGQPDVIVKQIKAGCYQVEVRGFDYFDTKTGELKSGGKKNIAMWALDTDYDNRSLFPRQVFFPMAGSGDGWNKLRKDIRAELNEELLEQFHGTVSLPFEAGENECIAVKIVDDRGIESLKVINLDRMSV
ncbi:site-specific DNA-methyltransferase [Nitrosomonas sp.]|uniref:site-specific DNA-methyltransferase n=1 Tax=Nitrosomonas sp. TaxID=42353 RepID=UPI00374DF54E